MKQRSVWRSLVWNLEIQENVFVPVWCFLALVVWCVCVVLFALRTSSPASYRALFLGRWTPIFIWLEAKKCTPKHPGMHSVHGKHINIMACQAPQTVHFQQFGSHAKVFQGFSMQNGSRVGEHREKDSVIMHAYVCVYWSVHAPVECECVTWRLHGSSTWSSAFSCSISMRIRSFSSVNVASFSRRSFSISSFCQTKSKKIAKCWGTSLHAYTVWETCGWGRER